MSGLHLQDKAFLAGWDYLDENISGAGLGQLWIAISSPYLAKLWAAHLEPVLLREVRGYGS